MKVEPRELVSRVMSFLPQTLPENVSLKISEPKGEKERLPNPTVAISNGILFATAQPKPNRDNVTIHDQWDR